MSKIENAILKASRQHGSLLSPRAGEGDDRAQINDPSKDPKRLALYRLQAGAAHAPAEEILERNRIIHEGYPDEALTRYKMLRTRVLQQMRANNWKTIAITAPHDGAGKTVTAINLAITLALQGGHDIYLVDVDLRNPSIADYLGLPVDIPGLADYLDGSVQLSDILWDVGVKNLVVLANRDRMSNSSEQLTSREMQEVFLTFRSASPNSIVIYDLPPVLTADDAVAVSPYVEGMLMVVSEGETTRDDLGHAMDMLRDIETIGVVLNKAGGR
jgi:protein-tyrosine kinase